MKDGWTGADGWKGDDGLDPRCMAAASLRASILCIIASNLGSAGGIFSGEDERLFGAMKSRDILPDGLGRLSSVQLFLIGGNII